MSFANLPVRLNGQEILAGWFNAIRTALIDSSGSEGISQQSFAGAASQTDEDVTGLVFDNTVTESVRVEYTIKTATLFEKGNFDLIWNGTVWSFHSGSLSGDDSLITMDVDTSTGQVTYTSGAETFTLKYKASTFNI